MDRNIHTHTRVYINKNQLHREKLHVMNHQQKHTCGAYKWMNEWMKRKQFYIANSGYLFIYGRNWRKKSIWKQTMKINVFQSGVLQNVKENHMICFSCFAVPFKFQLTIFNVEFWFGNLNGGKKVVFRHFNQCIWCDAIKDIGVTFNYSLLFFIIFKNGIPCE